MARYIAQARIVKLPDGTDEPDEWSSARSTMTFVEVSTPFDALSDDDAIIHAANKLHRMLINVPE